MPTIKQKHGNNDGRKLKTAEENFMGHQKLLQALRRLSQPKARPQIDGERSNVKRPQEIPADSAAALHGVVGIRVRLGAQSLDARHRVAADGLPCAEQEDVCDDDEDEESEDLEGETGEEDVVRRAGIVSVAFCDANEGGARDLHDCCDDVAGYEDGEDDSGWEWGEFPAVWEAVDEYGEDGVDCGAEEDGCYDDEEVLEDEEGYVVRVNLCVHR